MGIYRLNENLSVRLKALQLYIYWGALKGLNYIIQLLIRINLCLNTIIYLFRPSISTPASAPSS